MAWNELFSRVPAAVRRFLLGEAGGANPEETPEQRMEREIRELKSEFSRKSLRFATNLLRLKQLARSLDREEIFSAAVEVAAKGLEADRVQLLLLDRQKGVLTPVRAEGMAPREFPAFTIPLEESSLLAYLARRLATTGPEEGGALGQKECAADPMLAGLVGKGVLGTLMAAPIFVDQTLFGILNVERMARPDYSRDDLALLSFCADIAGLALRNSLQVSTVRAEATGDRAARLDQERKNQDLERSLARIIPPALVPGLFRDPTGLGRQLASGRVTVLFANIRGFTKLTEQTDPIGLARQLNEFFSAAIPLVHQLEGTIDKILAGGFTALFGALAARADDPIRGMLCAVRLIEAVRTLQEGWKGSPQPVLEVSIGLATGPVAAGFLGSEDQMTWTVVGEAAAAAAHLAHHGQPMQILVTKATHEPGRDLFEVEPLPPVRLKGRSTDLEVWAVKGVAPHADLQAVLAGAGQGGAAPPAGKDGVSAKPAGEPAPGTQPPNFRPGDQDTRILCGMCGTRNEPQGKFCLKCGMPIF